MTTDIIYRYKNQVYFNITNKCPCRCTFCIRNTEDAIGEASNLWFEHEPALEEIYKAIDEFDFSDCNEVVFCGYGEPTMALENLIAVSKYIRERYPFRIRLNTNGLSDLIHKRSTAKAQETEKLFNVLRKMRDDGKAIVIITHKMHEVESLSDIENHYITQRSRHQSSG